MPRKALCAVIFLAVSFSLAAQQPAPPARHFDGQSWWAHVKFLADDSLEGRETGSEGLRKAESYVVNQFNKAGLQPAGSNGFYQPVKFISRQIVEKDSSAALVVSGKAESLTLGDDASSAHVQNSRPKRSPPRSFFWATALRFQKGTMTTFPTSTFTARSSCISPAHPRKSPPRSRLTTRPSASAGSL